MPRSFYRRQNSTGFYNLLLLHRECCGLTAKSGTDRNFENIAGDIYLRIVNCKIHSCSRIFRQTIVFLFIFTNKYSPDEIQDNSRLSTPYRCV